MKAATKARHNPNPEPIDYGTRSGDNRMPPTSNYFRKKLTMKKLEATLQIVVVIKIENEILS
jgi:hypothetical protein